MYRTEATLAWTDILVGDFETCEFHCLLRKSEFLRVECDSVFSADVESLGCGVEAFLDGRCPEEGIVYAICFVRDF